MVRCYQIKKVEKTLILGLQLSAVDLVKSVCLWILGLILTDILLNFLHLPLYSCFSEASLTLPSPFWSLLWMGWFDVRMKCLVYFQVLVCQSWQSILIALEVRWKCSVTSVSNSWSAAVGSSLLPSISHLTSGVWISIVSKWFKAFLFHLLCTYM